MNHKKLLLDLIDREIHRISVQANLYDLQGIEWSSTKGASKRRKKLQIAREWLSEIEEK